MSQFDQNNFLRPISFYSKLLTNAERNYSTSEREALAIVVGIKKFRPYLFGKKFRVITDHKALVWWKRRNGEVKQAEKRGNTSPKERKAGQKERRE